MVVTLLSCSAGYIPSGPYSMGGFFLEGPFGLFFPYNIVYCPGNSPYHTCGNGIIRMGVYQDETSCAVVYLVRVKEYGGGCLYLYPADFI